MHCSHSEVTAFAPLLATLAFAGSVHGQAIPSISAAKQSGIDAIVQSELNSKGVPSASIAVVVDSRVVYRKAYGYAELFPRRVAVSTMRYGLGSISKEFLATAVLMLESEGRLKLDDKVGDYVPALGPAGEIGKALQEHK